MTALQTKKKLPSSARHRPHTKPHTPVTPVTPLTPTNHEPEEPSDSSRLDSRATWQQAFGFRDAVDLLYETHPAPHKPRLPTESDRTREWRDVVFPETVDELLGNASATALLRDIQQTTQPTKTNFIISGREGCGKRSFLRLLKRTLMESGATTESPCTFQTFNAKLLPDREITIKMQDATKKMDSEKVTPYLIVEHFEDVPIAIQQHHLLPLIAVFNARNIFAILVVQPDATKLPDQLRQRAGLVHMMPLEAMDVRTKLLQICANQKLGYHREALEELLELCRFDLLSCIAKLQQVFVGHQFVSLANVQKSMVSKRKASVSPTRTSNATAPVPPPFPLSIIKMNEPLRRCKLCTLLPPCSHVTLQHLLDRVERVRQYYPTRETESPPRAVCPSFCQRGICTNIQSIGRCRFAHPPGLHKIDTSALAVRCTVHTLPLPCLHCNHLQAAKQELREEEIAVARIQKELAVSRKLLLDHETERYMFVREQSKTVKWGAARRDYEEKLAVLDTKIQNLQLVIDAHQQDMAERRQRIQTLGDDVVRGRSKGMGRGNGSTK